MTHQNVCIGLIGLGSHAAKAYVPLLREHPNVRVPVVVDVDVAERRVAECLASFRSGSFCPDLILVPPFAGEMPPAVAQRLDAEILRCGINAVIISTEPECHGAYLRWAIDRRLHILVDKPILGCANATISPVAARGLRDEFADLVDRARRSPHVLVSVAAQRRWHLMFQIVEDLVVEAAERFGCPVTGIQSSHADGQLRLPHELGTIAYHGYVNGFGKLFHSGYHEIDLQARLIESAARRAGVTYDSMTTMAMTVRPRGFLRQLRRETWEGIFGREPYGELCPSDDEALLNAYKDFGELDVTATTGFTIEGDSALLATVDLKHNSFSRRAWAVAAQDLYKGNGRVKHEQHTIYQGPFQTVSVVSWQAKDKHDQNTARDFVPGGNSHLTITVFRNAGMWPSGTAPMQIIDAGEVASAAGLSASRLMMSHAKDAMLVNFIDNVTGARHIDDNPSSLLTHDLSMSMLCAIAESSSTQLPVTRELEMAPAVVRF